MSNADSFGMAFDWEKVRESKQAYRRKLAAQPIAEKLRMLDTMRERAVAMRSASATITNLIQEDGVFVDGDWVESKDQDPNGDVRLIQLADVGDGVYRNKSARFLTREKAKELGCTFLQSGDLLIARMPDPLGRACIFPGDDKPSVTVVDVCIVRTGTGGANHRWLMHRINSAEIRSAIAGFQSGSTRKRISRGNLARIRFSVPRIDEQHRIVAEIEKQFTRLDAGVASLRRVQTALKRYRASVLKVACEGRLVPTEAELARKENRSYETGEQLLQRILKERRENWNGKGKYKEPFAVSHGELPALPEGWTWTSLGAVIASGPQNGVYLPRQLYGQGSAILRIDDYQDGWVRGIDQLNKVTADPATVSKYQLLSGDLVINRVNSLTHLGKCLVVDETHVGALFESNMMKARLAECVNPRFVEFYLRSSAGRSRLIGGAKWAVNQASINQEDVKCIPLPLPPFDEQIRIGAELERRFSVTDELEATASANLQRGTRLRQSILECAFCERYTRNRSIGPHLSHSPDIVDISKQPK